MRFVRYILVLLIIFVTLGQETKAQVGGGLTPYARSFHRYTVGDAAVSTSLYLWRVKKGPIEAVRYVTDPTGKTNQQIFDDAAKSSCDYVVVSKNVGGDYEYIKDFPIVYNQATIEADFADKTKAGDNYEIYILWLKQGTFTLLSNEFSKGTSCYTTTTVLDVNVQPNPFTGELSWNSYTSNEIPIADITNNILISCVEPVPTGNIISFKLKANDYNKNWKYTYKVGVKYANEQTVTLNGLNKVFEEPTELDWKQTADVNGHDWTHLYSPSTVDGPDFVNINVTKILKPGESYVYIWVKIILMEDGFSTPVTNPRELVRCAVLKQLPKSQTMILD